MARVGKVDVEAGKRVRGEGDVDCFRCVASAAVCC